MECSVMEVGAWSVCETNATSITRRGCAAPAPEKAGGGFGDPLDRDPDRVLRDVVEEKVAPEHAQREYGVVLVESESDGVWAIDASATEHLRVRMHTAAAD